MTQSLSDPMLRVALTGGIATGKTHVLARFAALGVPTIDADRLARDVVHPGSEGWHAIKSRFGSAVLGPDERLDRKKLASVIFADPQARRDLEAIIHPFVYRAIRAWFADLDASGRHRLAIADIPLLYETAHESEFDRVIVTACAPEEQLRRVMARDEANEAEARQRLAAQWPIAEKSARADFVIRTDGTISDTNRQVEEVHRKLIEPLRD